MLCSWFHMYVCLYGCMDGETSLQIVDSTSLSSAGVAEQHFKTKNPDI